MWTDIWNRWQRTSLKSFVSLFLVGVILSVAIAACGGNGENAGSSNNPPATPVAANKQDVELTLVSFAVTKAAHDAIIPKFTQK
ncbi:MAG: sulfate ABC transporter substrate-binding protein, partial [Trichormus sp.]